MKELGKFFALARLGVAVASLLFCGPGCATVQKCSLTCRVWDDRNLRIVSKPAPDPKLLLFNAGGNHEVLVLYDACDQNGDAVKRRAYFLRPYLTQLVVNKKPQFVNPAQSKGMSSIPVLQWDLLSPNAPPNFPEYATIAKDGREFSVYQSAGSKETHQLPAYSESSSPALRIALTPLAVVGDTIIVTGAIAFFGILALGENAASLSSH